MLLPQNEPLLLCTADEGALADTLGRAAVGWFRRMYVPRLELLELLLYARPNPLLLLDDRLTLKPLPLRTEVDMLGRASTYWILVILAQAIMRARKI